MESVLVLTRKLGQRLIIGDADANAFQVAVMVTGQSNGQVKFGIEAPRHVIIHRADYCELCADGLWRPLNRAPRAPKGE